MSQEDAVWHRIIDRDALPEGEMMAVEVDERMIALYNVGGKFYATSNICTHAFAILTDGWLEDEIIECPLHAGRFDVRNGSAQGDPVECDLETFEVRVVDDAIEIRLPPSSD